jgi:hypothetical protein
MATFIITCIFTANKAFLSRITVIAKLYENIHKKNFFFASFVNDKYILSLNGFVRNDFS